MSGGAADAVSSEAGCGGVGSPGDAGDRCTGLGGNEEDAVIDGTSAGSGSAAGSGSGGAAGSGSGGTGAETGGTCDGAGRGTLSAVVIKAVGWTGVGGATY